MEPMYNISCQITANLCINVEPKPDPTFLLKTTLFHTRVFIRRESTYKISCHVAANLGINLQPKSGLTFLLQTASFLTRIFGGLCA